MKLLTLNAWGGKLHKPLLEFIEKMAGDIDIFCFQEVFSTLTDIEFSSGAKMNLYQDIAKILKSYQGYHSPKSKGYDYGGYIGKDVDFGNAFFIKKDIPVLSYEEIFDVISDKGYDWREHAIAGAQFITIERGKTPIAICNFHGAWIKGTHKKDTPERIEQSYQVKKILNAFPGEKILCGDFNLLPDGESMKILEKDMRDLIADYHITSTRSSLYKTSDVTFGDYVLVSRGITVAEFKVLPDEVSDHLALLVDFEAEK
jgi:endonuclease/exonuclease/phosphatase family metal-dependent hydrolase